MTKFLRAAISVAGLAGMLNVSAAQAVDIENYEATVEFAKQIAKCYDMAPPALLVWVGNPKVIVVKDFTTVAKIDSVMGLPAGYVQQFFSKPFSGKALIGNKSGEVRTLIFSEEKLKHNSYYTCRSVYHELMHLYDMKYGSNARRGTAEKSDRPEFQEAYKADVIQAIAYLEKITITTKYQENVIDYYSYFITSSAEAFAEVGATILYLHPQSRHYKNIDFLFPRLMAMVTRELMLDKIIERSHIGKVNPSIDPSAGWPTHRPCALNLLRGPSAGERCLLR